MSVVGLKACGACRHMNPPDARYCNQCGEGLEDAVATGHYTPRHLSEKILNSRSAMEGERKQVTVLFVDVKESVALSRQLDAERWHHTLDRFFALLTETVHRYEGTVNQYTGDGIMALFGAPIAHEDHAERACRAALDIQREIASLAADLRESLGIEFRIRQGLNSGEVVVGRIGDDLRMDYTAKGQAVGLAARMEELAHPDTILMSAYTHDLVSDKFKTVERGSINVKGLKGKQPTYELTGVRRRQVVGQSENAPLVGRERELDLLLAYRSQVCDQGQGLLVTISADTGLGKSRLCREFIRRCQEAEVPVFGVHGSSHHRAEPLAPICELFVSYLELNLDAERSAQRDQVMQRLQPSMPLPPMLLDNLLVILGIEDPESSETDSTSLRVEMAMSLMLRLLRDGAFNTHMVFMVENVHWLDDPNAAPLLDAFVDMLPHVPVLAVMTARGDYEFRWAKRPQVRNLVLAPLSEAQSQNFLDSLLGTRRGLEELRSEIVERAGGNPMFIEEVVEQLFASGVLERDGKKVKLKKALTGIELPPSVQSVVAARIDALPEGAKRLLQTAAVIGRRVPLELLRAVYAGDDFAESLGVLKQQRFLQRDVTPDSRAALLFSQSLFQVVACEAMLSEQRREIHGRVAQAMAAGPPSSSHQLAQRAKHHAAAGEIKAAAEAYLQAAEQGARIDLLESLRWLRKARELLDAAESDEIADLHLRILSRWLQYASRCRVDAQDLRAAIEQAEQLPQSGAELQTRLLYALARGSAALAQGEPEQGAEVLETARETAVDSADGALQLMVLVPLAFSNLALGRLVPALDLIDQGLALCEEDGQLGYELLSYSPLVALLLLKAWLSLWLGRAEQAATLARQALDWAEADGHSEQLITARSVLAIVSGEAGDGAVALTLAGTAVQQAQPLRNRMAGRVALMAYARCLLRQGQVTEAIVALEDGLASEQDQSFGLGEGAWLTAELSLAQLLAGNGRGARDLAQSALKAAEASGSRLTIIIATLAQIRAGLFSSRPGPFLRRYQQPLESSAELIQECQARWLEPEHLLLLSRWHALRNAPEEAALHRQKAEAAIKEYGLKWPLVFLSQDD